MEAEGQPSAFFICNQLPLGLKRHLYVQLFSAMFIPVVRTGWL
jgi:hypothetical protein